MYWQDVDLQSICPRISGLRRGSQGDSAEERLCEGLGLSDVREYTVLMCHGSVKSKCASERHRPTCAAGVVSCLELGKHRKVNLSSPR